MSKKISNFFLWIILISALYSCSNIKTLSTFTIKQNFKISDKQILRLSNYLNGNFYSYEIKRNVVAYPIAFILSKNGDKSALLACEGIINDCNVNVQIFQLIKKYNKIENDDYKILALEKRILLKNHNILNKIEKNKIHKLKKNDQLYRDFILIPSDSCAGEDC